LRFLDGVHPQLPPEQENAVQACLPLAQSLEYQQSILRWSRGWHCGYLMRCRASPARQQERYWLHARPAARYWLWEGWKGHHKSSLRIIQTTQLLPFDNKERLIIGSMPLPS
jgi:hypothetical protein